LGSTPSVLPSTDFDDATLVHHACFSSASAGAELLQVAGGGERG
jgi:hypothetical protein